MIKTLVLAFALVAAVAAVDKDGDVLILGDKTLADAVKENEFLLVEFYAPWCGHCKSLEPEYSDAATQLAGLDTPVALGKVDATEETAVAEQYEVQGYPTLKWFVSGEISDYEGGRTASEIVQWVKKKTGPPLVPLEDAAAVEEFKKNEVAVIGFSMDEATTTAVESAARTIDDVVFGVVTDAALAGDHAGKIVLFKTFDEGMNVYDGELTKEAISEFVGANSVPLVSIFTQDSASRIFGSGIDNHFLYFNTPDADSHEATMAEMKEVAADFKGKTLFVFVPAEEERVLEYFDFTADDLPKAILVSLGEGDMKKYGFDQDITAANIKAHVAAFHAGEVKPTLKSEDPPTDNSGPVTVLVGTTFDEIVMDESKDVLVEFYAPWCGHCKALTPVYMELGEKFADDSSIVIAKIDSTANDVDHPNVNVRGFPTIMWFPKGNKAEPMDFDGGRDLESFVAFVEKHHSSAPDGAASDDKDEL